MIAVIIVIFLVLLFILSFTQLGNYPEYAIMISFISGGVLAYIIYCVTNDNSVGFNLIKDLLNGKIIFEYIRKKHETERGYGGNNTQKYEDRADILNEAYRDEMNTLSVRHESPGNGIGTDSYIAASISEQAWGRDAKNKRHIVAVGRKAVQDHYLQVEAKREISKPDLIQELSADYYSDYKRPPDDIFK